MDLVQLILKILAAIPGIIALIKQLIDIIEGLQTPQAIAEAWAQVHDILAKVKVDKALDMQGIDRLRGHIESARKL